MRGDFFLLLVGWLLPLGSFAWFGDGPTINPHPVQYLKLKGYISPYLNKKVYLYFGVQYFATNPDCEHFSFKYMLAGLKTGATKLDHYQPEPNKKGYYSLRIPVDRYLPGHCRWVASSIGMRLSEDSLMTHDLRGFVSLNQKDTENYNPKIYNIFCSKVVGDCRVDIKNNKSVIVYLDKSQSYSLQLNLFHRRKK